MTTVAHEKLAALASKFRLSAGNHVSPDDGLCAMELVAFLDGLEHTDRPRCVSPAIGDYVRFLNDHIPEELRSRLLLFVPRLIGTVSEEHEQQRIEYFAWQTIRVFAPAGLRARGYRRFANVLQNCTSFHHAMEIAQTVRRVIAKKEGGEVWGNNFTAAWTPVDLAVHRAYRAAASADYAANSSCEILYEDEFSSCGYLAASAAFQAYMAGCTPAWDLAFQALEDVLAIGMPKQRSEAPARISETARVEQSAL